MGKKDKLLVVCVDEQCTFRITARPVVTGEPEGTWHITTTSLNHTCDGSQQRTRQYPKKVLLLVNKDTKELKITPTGRPGDARQLTETVRAYVVLCCVVMCCAVL